MADPSAVSRAEYDALQARLAAVEALLVSGAKTNAAKPKVVRPKKETSNSPIAAAAKVMLNPKIADGTLVRHVVGTIKKGNQHTIWAVMHGGKFIESLEDGTLKEGGRTFTSSPSNFGSAHYKGLMDEKHASVVGRKQDSCNGWTEVEYRKSVGSWASANELRPSESIKHVVKPVVVTLGPAPGGSNAAAVAAAGGGPEVVAEVVAEKVVRPKFADLKAFVGGADSAESQVTDEMEEVPPGHPYLYCETADEKKIFAIFQEPSNGNNWNDPNFVFVMKDATLEEFAQYVKDAMQNEDSLDLSEVDFDKVRNEFRAHHDVLITAS